MMYVDAVPTDGGGGTRSRRQSYAPPARLDSLKRDVENEAEFHNPEVILRSTSHVSQASQRSRLSQHSATRNVHRERVPNPPDTAKSHPIWCSKHALSYALHPAAGLPRAP